MKATADVQAQWEELGIALGLDESVLLTISEKHSSILQRHYEMMRYWIMNDTDKASWGALVCAMRSKLLDEENLAEEIAEKYLGMLTCLWISCFVYYTCIICIIVVYIIDVQYISLNIMIQYWILGVLMH